MIDKKIGASVITACAIALVTTSGCASQMNKEIDLLTLEQQRYSAIVNGDVETLDVMLNDDLIFTHASGKIDTKESFIRSLKAGTLTYNKIDTEDIEVRLFDSCGIVTGKSILDITVRGEDRKLKLLFTTVWVSDQHGWTVAAYQSTQSP